MAEPLRVLMITSEWPTPDKPYQVPFIVRQVEFLRRAGVDVTVFPFRGAKNPMNYLRAWQKARQELRSSSYDLVHAQWGQSGLLALPKRQPLVVTFRGDDLEGITGIDGRLTMKGRVLRNISRLVARAADQVILVSEHMARFIPGRSFHVIPSGLDLAHFQPIPQEQARQALGLDPQRKYVLFAGSVGNPNKRYALAQQVVAILQREMDVELLVATAVTHDQVPAFMNASDALLMTSIHEGSPNVVKEALACNLPVVSSDVGDVRRRIAGIPGCAIYQNDHPEEIAAILRETLRRGSRVDSRPAMLELDENVITQKVIQVYRLALASAESRIVPGGNQWRYRNER